MNILDFKGRAQAENWKSQMSDLNDRTNMVLGEVYACIDEIQAESKGDFVDRLAVTAAELAEATVRMMDAMDSIKSLIDDLISVITSGIGEAVQAVADNHMKATNL